ncbi:MAG: hypothetical protein IOD12_08380 [Silvanigrellales bacterium]|jgi:hypothetical protein|nr:hypothetical protein [Silvanigrellales bacterium]
MSSHAFLVKTSCLSSSSLAVYALGFAFFTPFGGRAYGQTGGSTDGTYVPAGGQNTQSGEYAPPQGEQPEYGKTFRPNTPLKNYILELNPLLVINRGIAVEFEARSGDTLSFGGDLVYRDAEVYRDGGVKGRVQFLGAAPKVRVYPLATLGGVFFGAKVMLGQNTLSISGSEDVTVFTVSPTAHVGYRVTTFSGFTLAAYIGGGVNLPAPEFKKEDLSLASQNEAKANAARDKVNKATGLFRPDFGLTLGIAL